MTPPTVFYGLAIPGNPDRYDGLIRQEWRDGGPIGFAYMSRDGWVDDWPGLVATLRDWGTRPVDEQTAARIARERFGRQVGGGERC